MWFTRFIEKQEPLLGERKLRGEAEKVDSEPDSQAGVCVWGARRAWCLFVQPAALSVLEAREGDGQGRWQFCGPRKWIFLPLRYIFQGYSMK